MGPKILAPKNFSEKIFGPKEFYVQRNIGPRKIVGSVETSKSFRQRVVYSEFSVLLCPKPQPKVGASWTITSQKKSMDEYAFIYIFQTSTIKLSHTLENSPALLWYI